MTFRGDQTLVKAIEPATGSWNFIKNESGSTMERTVAAQRGSRVQTCWTSDADEYKVNPRRSYFFNALYSETMERAVRRGNTEEFMTPVKELVAFAYAENIPDNMSIYRLIERSVRTRTFPVNRIHYDC